MGKGARRPQSLRLESSDRVPIQWGRPPRGPKENDMLKRLYVDNYRCLVNFQLEFQELTLLVGRERLGQVVRARCALRTAAIAERRREGH